MNVRIQDRSTQPGQKFFPWYNVQIELFRMRIRNLHINERKPKCLQMTHQPRQRNFGSIRFKMEFGLPGKVAAQRLSIQATDEAIIAPDFH